MRTSLLLPVVVASLATPLAAAAQGQVKIPVAVEGAPSDRVLVAPLLPAPSISMSEAVRLTVEHDAAVAIARTDVSAAGGRLRESKGLFDPLVAVRTTFGWNHTALRPFLRHREENKRLQFATVASAFGTVDAGLRKALASLTPRTPNCPIGFNFSIAGSLVPSIKVDRQDATELNLMGVQTDLGNPVGQSVIGGFSPKSVSGVCTPPGKIGFPLEQYRNLWGDADIAAGGNLGLNQFMANGPQYPYELASAQQQLAQTIATRAALGRARLGEVPLDEVRRDFAFEANWDKLRRNGWSYGGQLRLLSNQHSFVGKSLDPSFGGVEDPILFPSFATLNLTAPIARGGGRRTVEAPEQAAALDLRSESERIRHTISESTFTTVLAYLNLVAAQERLRYLEESAARQGQVLSATQQLVTAGDQPQAELGRARARSADAAAAVADGQLAVLEARVALADAIGVNVATIDNLPMAQGGFADVLPSIPTTDALMAAAMNGRRDRRALQLLKEAAGLLARAAQADRRPRFDATFSGGLSNTYSNPLFHYLPDELFPIFTSLPKPEVQPPSLPPSRFAAIRGFGRSLSGRWEPFFTVAVTYELPFGNNRYGGRALQAEASLQRSTVQAADIDRVILDNVTHAAGSLRSTAETILRRRETIELQRTTLDGALARMRGGDLSLIDTLTTEDDLKREQVQLVEDQLQYFSTLARLRFETGQLITVEGEGAPALGLSFSSREFITP
jgi:outer membrane protein TolC